jgi:NADH-quinone oxidoreductase subunit A
MIKTFLMLQEFGNAFIFVLLAAVLPPLILFVSKFFRPSFPHDAKMMTYECGEAPKGSAYVMFNNRFYLVAICFLVFDVEVALLFPVLALFKSSLNTPAALPVFLLSFSFLFVLFVGLIYEWKKGDIDWVKDSEDRKQAYMKKVAEKGRQVQQKQVGKI